MRNRNLIRMTSLFGVLMMTGCTFGNAGNNSNTNVTPNLQTSSKVTPSNYSGSQKTPDEGMIPGEKEMNALSGASFNVLYNTMLAEGDGANVLLSPASLTFALAQAENGANDLTLEEMEKYVNGGISIDDMNPLLNYTSYKLNNAKDVSWNVANSLWFNDNGNCDIQEEFLRKSLEYYDAEVYKSPFSDQTITDINNWCDKKTNGMIDHVLDRISKDAMMFIVNAIAFEGTWANEYSDSDILENRTFTNFDNTESKVTMLSSEENLSFELAGGKGFIKPYKGGEYSYVAILPEEGVSTQEYIEKITNGSEDFSEAVRNAKYGSVDVIMPEFTTDYNREMSDVYKNMGMTRPFDEHNAQFGRMFTNDDESQIWIGKVIHKTHIEVDRKGTKAAAVTVVEMEKCDAVFEPEPRDIIVLDRPFVYAIVDNSTGLPIFLGCQNSMQ